MPALRTMLYGLSLALAVAIAPASAQETAGNRQDPGAAATLPDILVEGRLIDQARRFVDEVSRAPGRRPLARWNGSMCVGVANMRTEAAQAMIDRIAVIGGALGVRSGQPGCRPNVLVVAAHGADAAAIVQTATRDLREFRPSLGGTDLGGAALAAFAASDAPVRWWHVSLPVMNETGELAIPLWGDLSPRVQVSGASRISSTVRNDLARVVIIIDVDKASSASFSALADYVALVALAQIDPEADVRAADTIMNLFEDVAAAPDGLTDWDANFLVSLYAARRNPMGPGAQETEVAQRMARAFRAGS